MNRRITAITVFFALLFGSGPAWSDAIQKEITFCGSVQRGESFHRDLTGALRFILRPNPQGWEILIREPGRPRENLARLTPPFHFVPNPRYLEGWHFRNPTNTGPNVVGDNINAPQHHREFIFSLKVGKSIRYPLQLGDHQKIRRDGVGVLEIIEMELGNLVEGKKAWFEWIKFKVRIQLGEAFQ